MGYEGEYCFFNFPILKINESVDGWAHGLMGTWAHGHMG
jgi:hypothetical protein